MTATRTDVHAPKNLVTEDYEFVACGNHATAELDAYTPMAAINRMVAQGVRFDDVHGGHHCSHCGSFLTYYAILHHVPSGSMIHVGETCLDNRFDLASTEFHALRRAAKLNRERTALKTKRAEWFAAEDDRQGLYDWAKGQDAFDRNGYDESFAAKFVRYVDKYGEVSDKFVEAIRRSKVRQAEWAAQRAAEALTATPVIEGRIVITGEVVSVKWQDNAYGGSLKMVVRDDRGFKVWGSVPDSISTIDTRNEAGNIVRQRNLGRGDRVSFTATVTRSDDQDVFGYFKRPTKAQVIEAEAGR
jgi:hypothetical protein